MPLDPIKGTPLKSVSSDQVRRTSEIEDITNLLVVHAIANRLTPLLARLHVHPNTVSLAGMAFGIAAGFAYYRYANPIFAIAGFLLMLAWHVADGVDGQLARLTCTQSELGKVLDGICDYVTFAAVYVALGLRLDRQHGALVWIVGRAAGLCPALQSAAYEAQRQDYDLRGGGRGAGPGSGAAATRVSSVLNAPYARVQSWATRSGRAPRAALDELLRTQPHNVASVRRRYRETFARPIQSWSILSANVRTIGLFACALLHAPLAYFLFEIVGFSLILAYLDARQRRRFAAFVAQLAREPLSAEAPGTDTTRASSASGMGRA